MNIGLALPQGGLTQPTVADVAIAAERAGIDSLWAFERLLAPLAPRTPYPASADGSLPDVQHRVLDPMLTLANAAAVTSTIRLGTSVLVAPWYPPLLLARAAASLDRLSAGRFTLGLGLGWSLDEFEAIGVPMAGLGRRLEEVLDVVHAAWADPVVQITTSREHVVPSRIDLKPISDGVPLLLAAFTPEGLDRIARRADGWLPAGIPIDAAVGMWAGVRQAAESYGRDLATMRLVMLAHVTITDRLPDGRLDFVGSIDQVREDVRRCAAHGVDELIIQPPADIDTTSRILELVASVTGRVASVV